MPGSTTPHVRSGRLRALAITSAKPSALTPELPSVAQTIPGYEVASRLAIFAPAGPPAPIITRLNQEIVRALNLPDVRQKFHATGIETAGDTPEALTALVKSEIVRIDS